MGYRENLVFLIFGFLIACAAKKLGRSKTPDFLHQAPEAHKSYQGWQLPGFCRPTWVLDRTFVDNKGNVEKRDRLFVKMQLDSSARLLKTSNRPWFDWRSSFQRKSMKKDSTVGERVSEGSPQQKSQKLAQAAVLPDGTWSYKEANFQIPAKFKLDMKDGEDTELYRYACNFEFGKLDGYAVKFQEGTIFRFRGINKADGLPINPEPVGSFVIRANCNRPIVSKDFQALQN